MKVDRQLIENYHKGFCTEQEQETIEKWLNDERPGFEQEKFDVPATDQLKMKIWATIDPVRIRPVGKRLLSFSTCIAAASVFLFCLLGGLYYFNSTDFGSTASAFRPGKTIYVSSDFVFKARSDRKLTFFSDSADGMSDCSKTLDVKKGEIYWITDRLVKGKKELVVVNKNKLHQLSQTLQKDLKQKF